MANKKPVKLDMSFEKPYAARQIDVSELPEDARLAQKKQRRQRKKGRNGRGPVPPKA